MHAYILYNAKSPHNVKSAVEKFRRRFGDRVIGLGQGDDGWERHVPGVEDQTDGACDWLST